MPLKKTTGRPPKFNEPRRPVTVTLPQKTLGKLSAIGDDRAKAIVKAVDAVMPDEGQESPLEVLEIGPKQALLVVRQNRALASLKGVKLVEISPGRHLIALQTGMPVESFEVMLTDLIESGSLDPDEHHLVKELHKKLRTVRRGKGVLKAEILLV